MNYNKIKELSTEKKINFSQLSEKIGMSRRGLYAAIENETLTIRTLEKIAEVLEVPLMAFFESQPGAFTSLNSYNKEVTDLNNIIKLQEEYIAKQDKYLQQNELLVSSQQQSITLLIEKLDGFQNVSLAVEEFINANPEFKNSEFLADLRETVVNNSNVAHYLKILYKDNPEGLENFQKSIISKKEK
jgi:transcriptional regulator with XRE-family HTH domain